MAASTSFAAMKSPAYRLQFVSFVLAMMADNIEHVISYWVVFQKFYSPALAGFAVLSHWLPFLFFSVAVGGLADRFDSRQGRWPVQHGRARHARLQRHHGRPVGRCDRHSLVTRLSAAVLLAFLLVLDRRAANSG
jgi:hypothetical protein